MAIRNIRTKGDEVLRKKCRNVDTINERTLTLIEDMIDTMYDADGVGLAAPQVGILKRIFVIDVYDDYGPRVFINPKILNYVKVKALNEKGEEFILEAEELLARAICHENDHLNGVLFVDHLK